MDVDRSFETAWDVLKWILLVLAMGFIAYVGRFGAQWLIERWRGGGKSEKAETSPSSADEVKARAKIEKKRIKAEKKAEKKKR